MGKLQSYMRRLTLTLVLKKQWYDMIASGEKVEEYRELKPYWIKRLFADFHYVRFGRAVYTPLTFKYVEFRLGYRYEPRMIFEIASISVGKGVVKHGAPADKEVAIIHLGKRVK